MDKEKDRWKEGARKKKKEYKDEKKKTHLQGIKSSPIKKNGKTNKVAVLGDNLCNQKHKEFCLNHSKTKW